MDIFPSSPDICARCAAQGRTCCSVEAGNEEFCFPVSPREMAIVREAGFQDKDLFLETANTPGFVEQLAHLLPEHDILAVFPAGGQHWRLGTTNEGHCVFLRETGCVLKREQRPFYCRLFPLWLYRGQLTWFTSEDCLANAECPSLAAMLQAMRIDSRAVGKLFQNMCQALQLEEKEKSL